MDNNKDILNFGENLNVAVIGATGGIGEAFVSLLAEQNNVENVFCFSRSDFHSSSQKIKTHFIDIINEDSIITAAKSIESKQLDVIIVASGILHYEETFPEKSLRDLSFDQMQQTFAINTFGPALIAKHFLPLIPKDTKSVFAALSARVGSIEDNHLGGWYSYRASKAALNMLIKTAAIEINRRFKNACVIGLHPGTVNTELSKPFQSNVAHSKLFEPIYSASCLLRVINDVESDATGQIFAWDGQRIPY